MTDATTTQSEEVDTEEVEDKAEAKTEAKPADTTEEKGKDSESSPEKDKVQERIDELTRKYRNEEREKLTLQQENEDLKQKLGEVEEFPTPDKTLADFDYDEGKYSKYLMEFARETAKTQVNEGLEEERNRRAKADFQSRESEFSADIEDYQTVTRNPALRITEDILSALQQASEGPALLYYLGKNPEIASRLAELPAHAVAYELGRIEALDLKKPEPEVTKAPAPTPKLDGVEQSTTVDPKTPDGDNLSTEDWMRRRTKQVRKQNG